MPLPRAKNLCGAKTRKGTPCTQIAMSNGRCRMHKGNAERGINHGRFKHGRYSKSVPDRLVNRYEKALADEERHDLRDEIALAESKVDDLLIGMVHGESDRLWLEMRKLELQMRDAPEEKAGVILGEIIRLIQLGGDEAKAWQDVDRWIGRKSKAIETDVKVAQVKQEMVSAEEVMALVAGILDAIRRHVEDQATRSALAREIRAIGTGGGEVIPIERVRNNR